MTNIFLCRTKDAHSMKILSELLQYNIKTACFEIDKHGIKLRMMDNNRTILVDLELDSNNFSLYKFASPEKLYVGINLTHFHKMLKSIKKRDSIELFITEIAPNDLGIKIMPKENNRTTTSYIKIQNIQNLDIDLPDGYDNPIIVPSGEFQKMCKGLTHISNITHITSKGFIIRFSSDAGGVMKRYTEFGEVEDPEAEESETKSGDEEYSEDFDTEQLTRITKIAGLSTNIQIFPKSDKPLLFKSPVGTLGKIAIYLKSKSLQELESRVVEDEEEDE